MKRPTFFAVILGSAVTACAPEALPAPAATPPDTIVRAARDIGADEDPVSMAYVQAAREEITTALARRREGDERGAQSALLRADADARLAVQVLLRKNAQEKDKALARRVDELNAVVSSAP